jgi:muramoyltetrapeptide carboxypeptidase
VTFLRQSGILDGVAAVVVGELTDCDWREDRSEFRRGSRSRTCSRRHLESVGVPAIYGLPLGHGKNLITVPLGIEFEVDGDMRQLSIIEPALNSAAKPPGRDPCRLSE